MSKPSTVRAYRVPEPARATGGLYARPLGPRQSSRRGFRVGGDATRTTPCSRGHAQRGGGGWATSHGDVALGAVTASTAGHGPIFFARGCDAPKPPRYTTERATVAAGPAVLSHWR